MVEKSTPDRETQLRLLVSVLRTQINDLAVALTGLEAEVERPKAERAAMVYWQALCQVIPKCSVEPLTVEKSRDGHWYVLRAILPAGYNQNERFNDMEKVHDLVEAIAPNLVGILAVDFREKPVSPLGYHADETEALTGVGTDR